jgi:hypothetical protein
MGFPAARGAVVEETVVAGAAGAVETGRAWGCASAAGAGAAGAGAAGAGAAGAGAAGAGAAGAGAAGAGAAGCARLGEEATKTTNATGAVMRVFIEATLQQKKIEEFIDRE